MMKNPIKKSDNPTTIRSAPMNIKKNALLLIVSGLDEFPLEYIFGQR